MLGELLVGEAGGLEDLVVDLLFLGPRPVMLTGLAKTLAEQTVDLGIGLDLADRLDTGANGGDVVDPSAHALLLGPAGHGQEHVGTVLDGRRHEQVDGSAELDVIHGLAPTQDLLRGASQRIGRLDPQTLELTGLGGLERHVGRAEGEAESGTSGTLSSRYDPAGSPLASHECPSRRTGTGRRRRAWWS